MTTSRKTYRVLPGWVFDGLHLSALAYGGIGAGRMIERNFDGGVPCCLMGLIDGEKLDDDGDTSEGDAMRRWLGVHELSSTNDTAVERINQRKRRPKDQRVSWDDYRREMRIIPDYDPRAHASTGETR